jgi:hypothetical protein
MLLDVLEAQIIALRASVDAMYAAIRAARMDAPAPAMTDPVACPHLETENVGTFGLPEYQCKSCGAIVPAE